MPETCAVAFNPKGLDMRDGTPETEVSELASLAGLPVPALPFAQRIKWIAEASPRAKLQRIEESEQPIPGLVAPALLSVERLDLGQCRLLQCEVGVQIDLGGLDGLMPEPQRDHRNINARLEEFHRRTVPKDMWRDPLAAKRRTSLRRCRYMPAQ